MRKYNFVPCITHFGCGLHKGRFSFDLRGKDQLLRPLPRQQRHIDQHILGKDAVARRGIVDQHVRHRAHRLPF